MPSIKDLAREVAQNMSAKTDSKIETAKETIITTVKETVVKEVIHDELNVDVSDLATKEELQNSIPDVSGFANASDVYTKFDTTELLNNKMDKSALDTLATKTELEESRYDDTEIKNALSEKANLNDLANKADVSALETKANLSDLESLATKEDTYTKKEVINLLSEKANLDDVFKKVDTYSAEKIQELLDLEANKDTVYTMSQIDNMLANKADASAIPDTSNLATKEEVESARYDDTEVKSSIDDLAGDIADVINNKANKEDLFKNGTFNTGWTDEDGSTHSFYAEKPDFGGIFAYNAPKNIKSYIGLNKSDEAGIDGQIYAINPDNRIGMRINFDAEKGAFYSKGTTNRGLIADDEIATMKDIPNVSDFVTTEQLNLKADKSAIPDTSNLADKDSVTTVQSNIDSLTLAVDSELDKKANKSDLNGLATEDYVNSKVYDDTQIKSDIASLQNNKADKTEIPNTSNLATKEYADSKAYNDTQIKSQISGMLIDIDNKVDKSTLDDYATKEYADSKAYDDSTITAQISGMLIDIDKKVDKADLNDLATKEYADSKAYNDTEVKADIAALQNNKADVSDIPDTSNFVESETLDNYATKDYADSKAYDDTDIKSDITSLQNDKADKSEIPDTTGLASEDFVTNAIANKADKNEIPDTSNLAEKSEIPDISGKLDKTEIFKNGVFNVSWTDTDGSTHSFNAEKPDFGGIFGYNAPKNSSSYIGLNKWTDNDKLAIQQYVKDRATNLGTRLNVSMDGFFYTKHTTSAHNFDADREVAVLGDLVDFYKKFEVDDALTLKADKTEIPDISTLADTSYVDQQDNDIKALVNTKIDANKVWNSTGNYFDTTNTLSDGSYAKAWNENSGGGFQVWTQPKNTLSFIGVNHWSDGDKVACQLYTKDKTTNIGVRVSLHPTLGAYYSKNVTGGNNNNFAPGREIAVKDDISALENRIAELEQLVETLQQALANAVDANGNSVYTLPTNN